MTRLWLVLRNSFMTLLHFFMSKAAELQAASLTFLEGLQLSHHAGFLLEIAMAPIREISDERNWTSEL